MAPGFSSKLNNHSWLAGWLWGSTARASWPASNVAALWAPLWTRSDTVWSQRRRRRRPPPRRRTERARWPSMGSRGHFLAAFNRCNCSPSSSSSSSCWWCSWPAGGPRHAHEPRRGITKTLQIDLGAQVKPLGGANEDSKRTQQGERRPSPARPLESPESGRIITQAARYKLV